MKYDKVLLGHGSGGHLTNELVKDVFLPVFSNPYLDRLEDGAVFELGGKKLCISTDSYVVNPVIFPGGDIGSLAVHGTVNDIAMCGARPVFLSLAVIIEEGLDMELLENIVLSISRAADKAGVQVVTGDTKVVHKGSADGIYINTSGIGIVDYAGDVSLKSIRPGDVVILNGPVGDHGAAILAKREDLRLESDIVSDSAPLNHLVEVILDASPRIHCMRDATRGGLGSILVEIAEMAGVSINIEEKDIPIRDSVRGVCEILGLDPLFLANEGKMVVFCPEADAAAVLDAMRKHEFGKDSVIIGMVDKTGRPGLRMNTVIGGEREIDLPTGELVPRIC